MATVLRSVAQAKRIYTEFIHQLASNSDPRILRTSCATAKEQLQHVRQEIRDIIQFTPRMFMDPLLERMQIQRAPFFATLLLLVQQDMGESLLTMMTARAKDQAEFLHALSEGAAAPIAHSHLFLRCVAEQVTSTGDVCDIVARRVLQQVSPYPQSGYQWRTLLTSHVVQLIAVIAGAILAKEEFSRNDLEIAFGATDGDPLQVAPLGDGRVRLLESVQIVMRSLPTLTVSYPPAENITLEEVFQYVMERARSGTPNTEVLAWGQVSFLEPVAEDRQFDPTLVRTLLEAFRVGTELPRELTPMQVVYQVCRQMCPEGIHALLDVLAGISGTLLTKVREWMVQVGLEELNARLEERVRDVQARRFTRDEIRFMASSKLARLYAKPEEQCPDAVRLAEKVRVEILTSGPRLKDVMLEALYHCMAMNDEMVAQVYSDLRREVMRG